MLIRVADIIHTIAATTVLLACADGSQPTQPNQQRSSAIATHRSSADVIANSSVTQTVFYACYVPSKGTVYRIKTADTPQSCNKKDVEFNWTDHGSSPISGLTFHSATATLQNLNGSGRFFATCDAGQSVMNFGYEIPAGSTATPSQIIGNRPTSNGTQTFWAFVATAGTLYTFYWTCVDTDPVSAAS